MNFKPCTATLQPPALAQHGSQFKLFVMIASEKKILETGDWFPFCRKKAEQLCVSSLLILAEYAP
jgi:hypothetical protein